MEDDSPVRLAYNLYGKDASGSFKRQSWDLATVVCEVEGINGYWNAKSGTALVNTEAKLVDTAEPPGYTAWFSDGNGKDAVLAQKESPEELAEMLNSRMIQAKKGPALRSAEEISISVAIFVLYQLAGEPLGEVSNDDLLPEKWAAERLFKEVDKNILSVDAEITYGCLSMILYQYALLSGSQMEHSTVEEEKNGISGRWQDDLDWAISEGLIINEEITADTPVCREQFAEILIRYCYIVFSEN